MRSTHKQSWNHFQHTLLNCLISLINKSMLLHSNQTIEMYSKPPVNHHGFHTMILPSFSNQASLINLETSTLTGANMDHYSQ